MSRTKIDTGGNISKEQRNRITRFIGKLHSKDVSSSFGENTITHAPPATDRSSEIFTSILLYVWKIIQ